MKIDKQLQNTLKIMVHHKQQNFSRTSTTNESTVQTFVNKYDKNVKVAKACGRSPDRKSKALMRGRPLMVGPIIDEKVRKFMVSLYKKGGHVSRSIAATIAMTSVTENWVLKASSHY